MKQITSKWTLQYSYKYLNHTIRWSIQISLRVVSFKIVGGRDVGGKDPHSWIFRPCPPIDHFFWPLHPSFVHFKVTYKQWNISYKLNKHDTTKWTDETNNIYYKWTLQYSFKYLNHIIRRRIQISLRAVSFKIVEVKTPHSYFFYHAPQEIIFSDPSALVLYIDYTDKPLKRPRPPPSWFWSDPLFFSTTHDF